MEAYPAITLSRSLGSGGTESGFLVAKQLGWAFCNRRILRLAAESIGHTSAGLASQEERPDHWLEHMLQMLAFGAPEVSYSPLLEMPVYSKELYELEREVMLKLAATRASVFVGRGGFCALQRRPATLHVSIEADLDFRISYLVARGKAIDRNAARKAIVVSDRDRAAFIQSISGLDWRDARNFDLVLDASKAGVEGCAARMVEEVRNRSWSGADPAGRRSGAGDLRRG